MGGPHSTLADQSFEQICICISTVGDTENIAAWLWRAFSIFLFMFRVYYLFNHPSCQSFSIHGKSPSNYRYVKQENTAGLPKNEIAHSLLLTAYGPYSKGAKILCLVK